MIPFSLFGGTLRFEAMPPLEIRALELSPAGFTARLPKAYPAPAGLTLRFYSPAGDLTEVFEPERFASSVIAAERFFTLRRFDVPDLRYRRLAAALSREYLRYIDLRLSLDDAPFTRAMTGGYPESEDDFGAPQPALPDLSGFSEVGALLYNNGLRQRFLTEDPRPGLTHIYIGNDTCPLLFPTPDEAKALLTRVSALGLGAVFVLAPIPESLLDRTLADLDAILAFAETNGTRIGLELNDAGTLGWCRERFGGSADIYAGTMLHKETKDCRAKYLKGAPEPMPDRSESAVYLPWYRTNTASFCTLAARIETGSRGEQRRMTDCPGYCERNAFVYPRHLEMISRGNSLYGLLRKTPEGLSGRAVLNL